MNRDIRLSCGFWRNPKITKLIRRLGLEAAVSLQKLWIWTSQERPTGILSGLDVESIADAAEWSGDADQFYQTLSELILIERSDGDETVIHGWTEHNEWQSGAAGRSAHARKLNHQRWFVKRGIACPDPTCEPCRPLRISSDSDPNQCGVSAESDTESTSRLVSSRSGSRKPPLSKASRLPDDFTPSTEDLAWAQEKHPEVNVTSATEMFLNHWRAAAGQKATKSDWSATWRNWIIREDQFFGPKKASSDPDKRSSKRTSNGGLNGPGKELGEEWKASLNKAGGGDGDLDSAACDAQGAVLPMRAR